MKTQNSMGIVIDGLFKKCVHGSDGLRQWFYTDAYTISNKARAEAKELLDNGTDPLEVVTTLVHRHG